MRAAAAIVVGIFGLAGCDAVLGISDHQLAVDGGGGSSGAASRSDSGSTGGSDSSCVPCVLGSATLGSCCVQ
jgi:hypothetical protein